MSVALTAALGYAKRTWPVFPMSARKVPLTEHGLSDATVDEAIIGAWWERNPDATPAIATGEPSGIVALDIDAKPGAYGFDSFEALGVTFHLVTPTAHTPNGGCHCLFRWPGFFVKTIAGKLGPGLDVRGDGGSLMMPPAPGRSWDPHLGLDVPIAPMPEWMAIREPSVERSVAPSKPVGELSPYCEAALDNALRRIVEATAGQQETTLNREAFGLGRLVGTWGMPPGLALDTLRLAAARMPSFDWRRPWRPKDIERKITDAFTAGLRHPRERRHG
jgi:Bifunctional DNA primase/polymerase, N-terminal